MHGMGKRAQALRVALGWGWTDHPGSRILGEWCYGGGGLGWWPVAQKTPSFWFFLGRQAACALQPVRACWWGPTLQPLYNDNTLTFLRTYRLRIYHKLAHRKEMLFPLNIAGVINLHHQTQQE